MNWYKSTETFIHKWTTCTWTLLTLPQRPSSWNSKTQLALWSKWRTMFKIEMKVTSLNTIISWSRIFLKFLMRNSTSKSQWSHTTIASQLRSSGMWWVLWTPGNELCSSLTSTMCFTLLSLSKESRWCSRSRRMKNTSSRSSIIWTRRILWGSALQIKLLLSKGIKESRWRS